MARFHRGLLIAIQQTSVSIRSEWFLGYWRFVNFTYPNKFFWKLFHAKQWMRRNAHQLTAFANTMLCWLEDNVWAEHFNWDIFFCWTDFGRFLCLPTQLSGSQSLTYEALLASVLVHGVILSLRLSAQLDCAQLFANASLASCNKSFLMQLIINDCHLSLIVLISQLQKKQLWIYFRSRHWRFSFRSCTLSCVTVNFQACWTFCKRTWMM